MDSDLIRKKYLEFWRDPSRNFQEIPNVSLVPNMDSTLLFVNCGMFPLVPYLTGEKHPLGKRLFNFQRSLRPKYEEILEVGDNRHTILFEMMGDWSLDDFDKTSQIPWILELFVKSFGFDPHRLYVSVWGGDESIPRDDIAINTWIKAFAEYGVKAEFTEDITKIPADLDAGNNHSFRIFPYGKKKNWWQRGEAPGELGGPSSEMFYDLGYREKEDSQYHINDDSGRFVEIGNNVFMEYYLDDNLKWQPLSQKNIDFGGGFERVAMCLQNKRDIFETDLFANTLNTISRISGKEYKNGTENNEYTSAFRVIADHARAAAFIIGDGIKPSNKDQGYILRRFIRRMVRFGKKLGIEVNFGKEVASTVIDKMSTAYPYLREHNDLILSTIDQEESAFRRTLQKGLKEIEKLRALSDKIDGKTAFAIYETFGFPIEMTLEEFKCGPEEIEKIMQEYNKVEEEHKELSRKGAEQKFKGGLADQSKKVVKLHTAHHLLLKGLQTVLGPAVKQRGSNITGERLRIDFNYGQKLSDAEINTIEDFVNKAVQANYQVIRQDMPRTEAEKLGAEMEFGQKYPDIVSVYQILDENGTALSKEFCGGPHVARTGEIGADGKTFRIIEQENIGSGLRRLKAKLI